MFSVYAKCVHRVTLAKWGSKTCPFGYGSILQKKKKVWHIVVDYTTADSYYEWRHPCNTYVLACMLNRGHNSDVDRAFKNIWYEN